MEAEERCREPTCPRCRDEIRLGAAVRAISEMYFSGVDPIVSSVAFSCWELLNDLMFCEPLFEYRGGLSESGTRAVDLLMRRIGEGLESIQEEYDRQESWAHGG